ncbi:HlyC/CorC family transporter [Proteus mirabilis]|uniref:HlyC/CorC family transporter n=1 Tax=Proteus mirabilis TaxID=584 RepID=UPI00158116FF|nr:HlyC/CorC family transporter [Proteus mirabilis]MBG6016336.1 HlyC/CorC family transporter [Proteus mirabilis]MBU9978764.1 HlyC/CorC family transporter [Proteus mirabilis]MDX4950300.1 HlyC/CorC family transporter [Proteus mirabilis]WFC29551.1 HlyC/CorC family transporter [Proteus mirabilis]HEK0624675.1 HlyC/CorC family transporter [Proteus mirabilis]
MEHVSTTTLIIILICMIFASAYFSGTETSMMTINRYRLRHAAKQGNRSAKRVEKLLQRPDRLISLVLIGNNLINIVASALATIVGMRLYGDAGVAIATGILTFIILIFAEVLPKSIAALYPERVAYPSSVFLSPLQKIMLPVVWFFNQITLVFMRVFGIKSPVIQGNAVSKEELRTIVNESKSKLSQRNQNMLISILDLEKVTIGDIMVPRNEIFGIDVNDEWKSIVRQLTHSPHGRIVLYRDTLDDVIGMLRVREAYRLMTEKKEFTKQILIKAADKIYFIPESTPLSLQLVNFQRNNEKAGIVVDEYGEIQGLVTVEDILEEIVGDFTTSMSPSLAEEVIPQKDGSLLVDGTTNIRDINKAFACHLPENEARTINGVIIEELGDLPVVGAKITIDGYEFEVLEVQDNVIKKALIRHLTPSRH